MAKKKKEKKVVDTQADFGHEIWGLIFLALGILVLISLISHFINKDTNILGSFLGTSLSNGLIYLFGPFPVFVFPAAICYIGWIRMRGDLLQFRILFYWTILTFEVCLLLAIHNLPLIVLRPEFNSSENFLGLLLLRLIYKPIFGRYQFGPYFITILALLVTILSWFKISPQCLVRWLRTGINWCTARFAVIWKQIKRNLDESREKRELAAQIAEKRRSEKKAQKEKRKEEKPCNSVSKKQADLSEQQSVSEKTETDEIVEKDSESTALEKIEDVEEEVKEGLDQELAAFRARRNEPIKIMTIETSEIELDEEPEYDYESGISPEPGNEEKKANPHSDKQGYSSKPYKIPDPSVLPDPPPLSSMVDKESIESNSFTLEKTLMNFNVEGKVVFVSPGPVVTRYEIELAPGIKVSRVVNLHDDISMAVSGQRIRIEAPIPGKSAVGIELPNTERQIVHFKHILLSDAFRKSKAKLPVIIGTNISGAPYVTDITKMPHVLIAGQTGSGKSVCINSIICSLLMTKKPEELRLIMIDPKKVELAFYEGIPHLMSPVVTESKEAVKALQWGVIEMERRYRMLAKVGARNVDSFNARVESGKIEGVLPEEDNKALPFIVIIVDELADLMMTASKDVEGLIQRIAQLARAVGIHLIVATQRPSVDIITGPIKANLTSRIGFRTIQSTDSRTILGHVGAEKLLGMGDMLFLRNGAPEIERFHGAFISEEDVEKIVAEIRSQKVIIQKIESFIEEIDGNNGSGESIFANEDRDELFEEAANIIVNIGQGSTSLLQRRMKIGYARAGRLMDELERAGFVGPQEGSKVREVLVKPDELDEHLSRLR
ncbi:MAG: DNA translocase FtsK [Fibrobacter sp.]|nr:DNA translocase FtsK [Fibrobacter sp.]